MSDTKKYYYLRLKDNFFQSPNVRYLETMKNGCEYIVLLLKLQLLSINIAIESVDINMSIFFIFMVLYLPSDILTSRSGSNYNRL